MTKAAAIAATSGKTQAQVTTYTLARVKRSKLIRCSAPQGQQYRGMMSTASGIVREEGVSKLWRGVTPALYRHVVYRYKTLGYC